MHVHFLGEPDNGIRPSSQWASALSTLGFEVSISPSPASDRREWLSLCDRCDIIHVIAYSQTDHRLLRKLRQARMRGVELVRHWVGSDCLWALHHEPTRRFAHALAHLGALQITVADHLTEELATIALRATTLRAMAPGLVSTGDPPALPKQLTVLCYLPGRRRLFYGGSVFDFLVREFPDAEFIVLGDGETDYRDCPNVTSIEHTTQMAEIIARCSVLIRPTMHDGIPRMMLETLSLGRQVIASHKYDHCHHACEPHEYAELLRAMQREPTINWEGCRYVREAFALDVTAGALVDQLSSRLTGTRVERRRIGRRQAMALALRRPTMFLDGSVPLPTVQDLPMEASALRAALSG